MAMMKNWIVALAALALFALPACARAQTVFHAGMLEKSNVWIAPNTFTKSGCAMDFSSSDSRYAEPRLVGILGGCVATPTSSQKWITPDVYISRVEGSSGVQDPPTVFNSRETVMLRLHGTQIAASSSSFTPLGIQLFTASTQTRGTGVSAALEIEAYNQAGTVFNIDGVDVNIFNQGAGIIHGYEVTVSNQTGFQHDTFSAGGTSASEERGLLINTNSSDASFKSPSVGIWIDTPGGGSPFGTAFAITGARKVGVQIGPSHWGGNQAVETALSIPGPADTGICVGKLCQNQDATGTPGGNPTYPILLGRLADATVGVPNQGSNPVFYQYSIYDGTAKSGYVWENANVDAGEVNPRWHLAVTDSSNATTELGTWGPEKFLIETNFEILHAGSHVNAGAAGNTDAKGEITLVTATSASYSFATAYQGAPVCVLTPTSDLGATSWWVTTTTTAVTAHASTSVSASFYYHCFGHPN